MNSKYHKTVAVLEQEFDVFFERHGFSKVSQIVGMSPDFSNCDYLRSTDHVLVELKILEADHFKDGGVIDRFHSLVAAPENIDARGLGIYRISFPEKNREGKHDTFEEPLRRILKKANRQLKETNSELLKDNGFNLLVLVANGFSSLHPEAIYSLVQELLNEEFKHIHGMMLLFPTWALYTAEGELAHPLCYMSIAESLLSKEAIVGKLCENWLDFMASGGHTQPIIIE